jgi:hypothetical protein
MKRQYTRLLLIGLVLVGFALRLYRLDVVALRGDEAFSAQSWAGLSLSTSLDEIAAIEPHPVLTYVLFRLWGVVFGIDSEWTLRLLPALASVIGIPALYALGVRLTRRPSIGIIAAALWAIHPFQIWHAQDFRNYAIWSSLSIVTYWLAWRVIDTDTRRDWLAYALMATLACLIFYMELLTIGVLGLYALLTQWRRVSFVVRWSALNLGIIALTIGTFIWLQGDLITSGEYGGTTGGLALAQYLYRFVPVLNLGETAPASSVLAWVLLVWLIVCWVLILQARGARWQTLALFVAIAVLAPFIVLALISTRMSIFRPRYVMQVAPIFTMMIASGFYLLAGRPRFGRVLALGGLVVWVALASVSLWRYHYSTPPKALRWDDLTAYLDTHTTDDELIIQTGVDAAFGYYYAQYAPPAPEIALPVDPFQTPAEIDALLTTQIAPRYDSVWVVGQTFPDWVGAGTVERWMRDERQLVRSTSIGGLPAQQFRTWQVNAHELPATSRATFTDVAVLRGAQHYREPDDMLTVWLYWQARSRTARDLKLFVHLVGQPRPDSGSPLWAQDDHFLQRGRMSSMLWDVDVIYRDVATLSLAGVPTGVYQIQVGWYDPVTNQRVMTTNGTDAFNIGTIVLE